MNDIVANRLGLAKIREVQSMGPSEVVFKRMYDSNRIHALMYNAFIVLLRLFAPG